MSRLIAAVLTCLACPSFVTAQTAPSASEIASFSPLFLAAHDGSAEDVFHALAAGGSIDELDGRKRTAAHIAAFASNDAALAALAESGVDMNALEYQLYDIVTIAAVADDPDLVRRAIELGNRADLITSVYDGTALIAAAHLGHFKVIDVLVKNGAPLDHVNNLGWTALIEAVVLGDGGPNHVETARLLLEAGADQTTSDSDGVTPIEHARRRNYKEMERLLSDYAN